MKVKREMIARMLTAQASCVNALAELGDECEREQVMEAVCSFMDLTPEPKASSVLAMATQSLRYMFAGRNEITGAGIPELQPDQGGHEFVQELLDQATTFLAGLKSKVGPETWVQLCQDLDVNPLWPHDTRMDGFDPPIDPTPSDQSDE